MNDDGSSVRATTTESPVTAFPPDPETGADTGTETEADTGADDGPGAAPPPVQAVVASSAHAVTITTDGAVMKSWYSRNGLARTSVGTPMARNWSRNAVATATWVGSLSTSMLTVGICASGKAATKRARALPSLRPQGSPQASGGHRGNA